MRGVRMATLLCALTASLCAIVGTLAQNAKRGAVTTSDATAGLEAFGRIASVLQSPRCLNCHPRGNRPTQGDDMHVHFLNVQRGPADHGVPAMRCSTCHQTHNNEEAGIPGAPRWGMAPVSMGWVGLSRGELCRTVIDRKKNGGRSLADLVEH